MRIKADWSDFWAMPLVALALAGFIAAGASACSARTRHIAVVVDTSLYEVLYDVHASEQIALCGQPSCANFPTAAPTVPGWTHEKSQRFNRELLPAVEAGQKFNEILLNWDTQRPATMQVLSLVAQITKASVEVVAEMPDGPTKQALLTKLGKAQSSVLNILTQLLSRSPAR